MTFAPPAPWPQPALSSTSTACSSGATCRRGRTGTVASTRCRRGRDHRDRRPARRRPRPTGTPTRSVCRTGGPRACGPRRASALLADAGLVLHEPADPLAGVAVGYGAGKRGASASICTAAGSFLRCKAQAAQHVVDPAQGVHDAELPLDCVPAAQRHTRRSHAGRRPVVLLRPQRRQPAAAVAPHPLGTERPSRSAIWSPSSSGSSSIEQHGAITVALLGVGLAPDQLIQQLPIPRVVCVTVMPPTLPRRVRSRNRTGAERA